MSGFIPPDDRFFFILNCVELLPYLKKSFGHRLSTIHLIEASDPT